MCEYWALRNTEWHHKYGTRALTWKHWFTEKYPKARPVTAKMFTKQEAKFKDNYTKGSMRLMPDGTQGYFITVLV
jgi:hypothetical protein